MMTGLATAILCASVILTAPDAGEEETMKSRSERIEEIFNALNKDTMHLLDDFYHGEIVFEDPLGHIEGLEDLRAYYANLYEGAAEVSFAFTDEVVQDDTHIVMWIMRMKVKRLNKGEPIEVVGNSLIRFGDEDKVVYHRDYFDMGAMIYEHVPVVGWMVKKVKKRLQH